MQIEKVPAVRLKDGEWNHGTQKEIPGGDIAEAYSADVIGSQNTVRRPFKFSGALWVCVCRSYNGAEAYRLVSPELFDRPQTTYREKTRDAEACRNDPNGFYDGMTVKWGGKEFVLCGPKVRFETDEIATADPVQPDAVPVAEQGNLFGGGD